MPPPAGDPQMCLLCLPTKTTHAYPLSIQVAPLYPMPKEGRSLGSTCRACGRVATHHALDCGVRHPGPRQLTLQGGKGFGSASTAASEDDRGPNGILELFSDLSFVAIPFVAGIGLF